MEEMKKDTGVCSLLKKEGYLYASFQQLFFEVEIKTAKYIHLTHQQLNILKNQQCT
jgi:hypothetical protein